MIVAGNIQPTKVGTFDRHRRPTTLNLHRNVDTSRCNLDTVLSYIGLSELIMYRSELRGEMIWEGTTAFWLENRIWLSLGVAQAD